VTPLELAEHLLKACELQARKHLSRFLRVRKMAEDPPQVDARVPCHFSDPFRGTRKGEAERPIPVSTFTCTRARFRIC